MILDKKQIQVIFLYQFKMGCKTAQTTWNINEASGPWTANEHTVQWRFKKFCKGDNSLEDECSGQPLEVDNTNWEAHQSLTTTWEVAEETDDHSMVGHLKQSGKVKKLNKGCFHELTTNQKKLFWSVFFSYSMQQWQSISRSDWEVQWKVYFIWQLEMISSVAGSRRNSKALPKAKPAPKKRHGHWLVVCCWSDPLQLSESWQNHYIWEVCSAHDEMHWKLQHLQPVLVNRKGPVPHDNAWPHATQPRLQKWNQFGYQVLPHSPYSSDLLPTTISSILTTFCRENTSITSRRQKMLSKSLLNPEAWIFILQ